MMPADPPESLLRLLWIIVGVLATGYPALLAYIAKMQRDQRKQSDERADLILKILDRHTDDLTALINGIETLNESIGLSEKYAEINFRLRQLAEEK